MKKIIIAMFLALASTAYANQDECINKTMDAIFNAQVKANHLSDEDKAKFAVQWYGAMINQEEWYVKMENHLQAACTSAYIMALPMPDAPGTEKN